MPLLFIILQVCSKVLFKRNKIKIFDIFEDKWRDSIKKEHGDQCIQPISKPQWQELNIAREEIDLKHLCLCSNIGPLSPSTIPLTDFYYTLVFNILPPLTSSIKDKWRANSAMRIGKQIISPHGVHDSWGCTVFVKAT